MTKMIVEKDQLALWTAAEVADAAGGRLNGGENWCTTGVSIDTRTLQEGDLFVALVGEANNGHDYVAQAFEKGAVAAIVSDEKAAKSAKGPCVLVKDTFKALQDLGIASRERSGAVIVAVTGSVGKTGTKEMLAGAFGAQNGGRAQTHASKKSYNNEFGVPLSLANMHDADDYGIFEIGMNHPGEITPLSQMVRPQIAIITTVAPVHMEHFKSVEEIAAAKAEIFDGMGAGGIAVLNRDNEWFQFLKARAEERDLIVLSFGEHKQADARLVSCIEAINGSRVEADICGEKIAFNLQIPGRHIVMNALAVLLAVRQAGGSIVKAARALGKLEPIAGRGLREYLDVGDPNNPVTLIDESYNASPVAMRAAFRVLAMVDPGRGGRRIAVLGDMLELGDQGPQAHKELALPLEAADVQLVYTCGALMKNLYEALPQDRRGAHRETSVELAQIVPDVLTPGDVVMVKGSNGSKMGTVVEALRALPDKLKGKKTGREKD